MDANRDPQAKPSGSNLGPIPLDDEGELELAPLGPSRSVKTAPITIDLGRSTIKPSASALPNRQELADFIEEVGTPITVADRSYEEAYEVLQKGLAILTRMKRFENGSIHASPEMSAEQRMHETLESSFEKLKLVYEGAAKIAARPLEVLRAFSDHLLEQCGGSIGSTFVLQDALETGRLTFIAGIAGCLNSHEGAVASRPQSEARGHMESLSRKVKNRDLLRGEEGEDELSSEDIKKNSEARREKRHQESQRKLAALKTGSSNYQDYMKTKEEKETAALTKPASAAAENVKPRPAGTPASKPALLGGLGLRQSEYFQIYRRLEKVGWLRSWDKAPSEARKNTEQLVHETGTALTDWFQAEITALQARKKELSISNIAYNLEDNRKRLKQFEVSSAAGAIVDPEIKKDLLERMIWLDEQLQTYAGQYAKLPTNLKKQIDIQVYGKAEEDIYDLV